MSLLLTANLLVANMFIFNNKILYNFTFLKCKKLDDP